jgi:hypothetical protein
LPDDGSPRSTLRGVCSKTGKRFGFTLTMKGDASRVSQPELKKINQKTSTAETMKRD